MTVPALRRLPVPVSEPPYDPFDDEYADRPSATTGVPAVQGTLALAFVLPTGVPAQPTAPPDLRLLPRPEAEEAADEVEFGPQPTATRDLPEIRGWAARFAQALVEVLAGDRPLAQLVRWTSATVYDELAGRVLGPQAVPATSRGVVRSLHVSAPADGVAEVAALVRRDARSTALALRLEGLDGRWQCTALELG
jgi:hypothetical protein